MITDLLKKIYARVNFNTVTDPYHERMTTQEQKKFLSRFPEPVDDYERSYFKYLCFKEYFYRNQKSILALYNIGAMFLYPVLYGILKKNNRKCIYNGEKADAVVENVPRLPNDDVIPTELKEKYRKIQEIQEINYFEGTIGKHTATICRELRKRYFFNFYFRLICLLKLAQFDRYIQEFSPQAIIFYSYEREFTGPLQTVLCENSKVDFITFMHGDYLYSIAFAFQRYSLFYTWDELYNRMFKKLRCVFPTVVYLPDKLKGIADNTDVHECRYYATYYFSNETRECAEMIRSVFDMFRKAGLRCKIRPHPRYSDLEMLKDVFNGVDIEDTTNCSLADSISDSFYIIGLNTTVLSQAFFSGKTVVIDDISKTEEYKTLSERGYIMLSRPHILLSSLRESLREYDNTYAFYSG